MALAHSLYKHFVPFNLFFPAVIDPFLFALQIQHVEDSRFQIYCYTVEFYP